MIKSFGNKTAQDIFEGRFSSRYATFLAIGALAYVMVGELFLGLMMGFIGMFRFVITTRGVSIYEKKAT